MQLPDTAATVHFNYLVGNDKQNSMKKTTRGMYRHILRLSNKIESKFDVSYSIHNHTIKDSYK